jgi:uncharacterized protein YjbJ (UPF0337 family)
MGKHPPAPGAKANSRRKPCPPVGPSHHRHRPLRQNTAGPSDLFANWNTPDIPNAADARAAAFGPERAFKDRRLHFTERQNCRRPKMKNSTKQQIEGDLHDAKGTAKEAEGKRTHNRTLEAAGRTEKVAGIVQKKLGKIEKLIGK